MNNTVGLLISIGYVGAMLLLAEGLRRARGYSPDFTRKFIHIGVGMMAWFVPFIFDSPWTFVGVALLFAIINLLDWRYGLLPAMASDDSNNLGTVYFPLAAAAIVLLFWDQPPLLVAALMPLTWGDGLAPVVGRRWGRHPYKVAGHGRTWEGSAAFLAATWLTVALALVLMPGAPTASPEQALMVGGLVAGITAVVEGVSLYGLDNLTVTAAAAAILSFWPF